LLRTLWFSEAFLRSQSKTMEFLRHKDLTIPYELEESTCRVGFIGPYSCAFDSDENPEGINYFESAYLHLIEKVSPNPILIRLPVKRHFENEFRANISALDSVGFKVSYIDVNSTIQLGNQFRENYNRNRMRDIRNRYFREFEVVDGEEDFVYGVLSKNREQIGAPMSISYESFRNNLMNFPDRFQTKLCVSNGIPVAGALLVNVNSQIQYVFMWGNDKSIENSGLALFRLADEIFISANKLGFKFVCLGTSSIHGNLNLGLMQFKNSLGAQTDLRYTLKYVHDFRGFNTYSNR
jgi:hypothetical protein